MNQILQINEKGQIYKKNEGFSLKNNSMLVPKVRKGTPIVVESNLYQKIKKKASKTRIIIYPNILKDMRKKNADSNGGETH